MRTQNAAASFMKPFWRSANAAGGGAATANTPAKHFHAVGEFLKFFCVAGMRMHCLSVASASQVSESSARNQATRGFLRMINGRQYAPVRGTLINGVVVQAFLRGSLARGLR